MCACIVFTMNNIYILIRTLYMNTTSWSSLTELEKSKNEKAKNKKLKSELEKLQNEMIEIKEASRAFEKLTKKVKQDIITVKPTSVKSEAVAVAVASDWHAEEIVKSANVNGINKYNKEVFLCRSREFFEHVIRLTEIQRSGIEINTLVLYLLGDFTSGHIHEDLVETTRLSPLNAIAEVEAVLSDGIKALKQHFDKIIIPCSYGNHTRTTAKRRCSTASDHNFEFYMYNHLRNSLESEQVSFTISPGYHTYTNVLGHVIRSHHGDNIRYGGGVGGITIPVVKAIAQWDKGIRADLDVFGHYHQFLCHRKFVANGSMIGFNDFALSIKADPEPPQQAYFLIDKKRGRTITSPISFSK